VVVEAGIIPADRADTWYQADRVVTCVRAERGARAIAEPRLIVEVLSPSTAARPRRQARRLPRDRRGRRSSWSRARIATSRSGHRRGDRWEVQDLIGDAALSLVLDGQPLPLAALYDGVAL
jgi:Uma2 family endonuclease